VWQFNWGVFWAVLGALAVRAAWVTLWSNIAGALFPSTYVMFRKINDHLSVIRDNLAK